MFTWLLSHNSQKEKDQLSILRFYEPLTQNERKCFKYSRKEKEKKTKEQAAWFKKQFIGIWVNKVVVVT